MKHLGDITKINGAEIEAVDVITGGSPCQDLSIAGKRAGLAGARSGLFMEQVRIVKEMREHDRSNGRTGDMVRPRFMVWENVPGAFSSNKGRDFAAVLEEIIRIAEPEAPDIEVPEKGWNTWGGYHDEVGGRWSVAWRVHDAQHWGVPQRRRRISVVADFGGDTAGEILFERKSVSRHFAESGTARERLAGDSESGAGRTGESIAHAYGETGVGYWKNGVQTLRAEGENRPSRPSNVVVCMATQQGGAELRTDDRSPTLTAAAGMSGNNQPVVCAGFKLGNSEQARSIGYAEEQAPTLCAECGGNKPAVVALDMTNACDVIRECGEVVPSLQARMGTSGNQVPHLVETRICDAATMRTSPVGGLLNAACLTPKMLNDYLAWGDGYGWHISDLRIYDETRELSEFTGLRNTRFGAAPYDIKRAPQSWGYVQEVACDE